MLVAVEVVAEAASVGAATAMVDSGAEMGRAAVRVAADWVVVVAATIEVAEVAVTAAAEAAVVTARACEQSTRR